MSNATFLLVYGCFSCVIFRLCAKRDIYIKTDLVNLKRYLEIYSTNINFVFEIKKNLKIPKG